MKQIVVSHWNHFWFRQVPPHALALARIGFGFFLLLYFSLQFPTVAMRYSSAGIILPLFRPTTPLTVILTPPPPPIALLVFLVLLVFLLLFTLGWHMRIVGTVAVILYLYYWFLSLHLFDTSFDRIFLLALAVLTFSGADRVLSVRSYLEGYRGVRGNRRYRGIVFNPRTRRTLQYRPPGRGRTGRIPPLVSVFPQRLLAIQLTVTYLGVGLQKLVLPGWDGGEVLTVGFAGRWATPLARWLLLENIPLSAYDLLIFLIIALELTLPFGLWSRRMQRWFFALGFLFHLGIALLLGIWWFLALPVLYILFVDPEEVKSGLSVLISFFVNCNRFRMR
ncbi:MAG: HTTM domain protein [Candidatus Peregrinibacteria bacterium Greene0416_19]|nr:MAG: HTTM domain protein [Candidatus Peregrinibacteria bacterium Greene0416_19]